MKKFNYFIKLSALLVALSGAPWTETADAANPWREIKDTGGAVSFWLREGTVNTTEVLAVLKPALQTLNANLLFGKAVPAKWGILLDSSWQGASGYSAPDLRAPDGSPAILLKPTAVLDPQRGKALLIHEAIHLTHYTARPHEESWVQEGVALLGEYLVTGYFNPALALGFSEPETSLTAEIDPRLPENDPQQRRGPQYGHVLQYFYYLYRLCGGESLYREILFSRSAAKGIEFLDEVLAKQTGANPVCKNFETSFVAFENARFKQNRLNPAGYVAFGSFQAVIREKAASLPAWSAMSYRPSAKKGTCEKGDELWTNRCIRISKGTSR